jgi:preprotein translocase subunit SecG
MLYYLTVTFYVLVCLLLLVVVLLQQGKGGDIAAAFGGASSQTAFGARAGATVLTRATTILGALFMIGALTLTIIGRTGGGSVVGGISAPAPVEGAAPALPTTPLPSGTTPDTTGTGSGSTTPPPATPPASGGSGSGSTPPPANPPAGSGSGS